MSKLTDTFFRAVIYKAVWKMPWWLIIILIVVIGSVAWHTIATYIGLS